MFNKEIRLSFICAKFRKCFILFCEHRGEKKPRNTRISGKVPSAVFIMRVTNHCTEIKIQCAHINVI